MAKVTSKVEDALTRALADLGVVLANRAYISQGEFAKAYMLEKRCRALLEAEPAGPLLAEIATFVGTYIPQIETSKRRTQDARRSSQKRAPRMASDGRSARRRPPLRLKKPSASACLKLFSNKSGEEKQQ